MSFSPTPMQVLILWKMIFMNEHPTFSQVKKDVRQPLIDAELVETKKQGRSSFITLTDKAWDWAVQNLDAKVSTRSPQSGPVLQQVLTQLKTFMQQKNISLHEFLNTTIESEIQTELPEPPTTPLPTDWQNLESRIREAYFNYTNGKTHARMRLSNLRNALPEVPRPELDEVLRDLKITEKVILLPFEDPQERTQEDEEAALNHAGRLNHVIIIEE